MERSSTYVVDTHVLYWYLREPGKLSPATDAVFRLAETGNAVIIVPAIAVAELYFMTLKKKQPLNPSRFLSILEETQSIELSPLDRQQLIQLELLPDIPELHDRLIASESYLRGVPLLTKDKALRSLTDIKTIW